MKYYKSSSVKNHKLILYKLRFNKKSQGYFVICIDNGPGLLAILSTKDYLKYKEKNILYKIIGVAKGKKEAKEVILQIVSDYYKKYKDFSDFKIRIQE